jgi:hypothetical protein
MPPQAASFSPLATPLAVFGRVSQKTLYEYREREMVVMCPRYQLLPNVVPWWEDRAIGWNDDREQKGKG